MELLSPISSFDTLYAAVGAGADAVYMGGKNFSARYFAQNFSDSELARAIHYCQKRGVKVYITVNTLVTDREFKQLSNFIALIYEEGADGVIVQDLGVARLIKSQLPKLPLHGSTQMTIHTLDGVKLLEKMGFKRVVLSRELSLEQIRHICKNSSIEIEVFAHGALCVSYSGQCLMSSMIGSRSANRGKCAQPCRLPYQLNGKKGTMLSLKDLSLIRHINELSDAGVDCIKIEGRMKDADYVGLVTETYRKAIDNKEVTESDIQKLESVFYRGGYTDEYLTGKKSQDMYAVKRDENPYLRQVKYEKPPEKKPLYDIKRREKVVINIEKFNYKNRKKLYISAQIRNIKQYNAVSETEISRIYVPADLIVKHSDIMDFSRVVCVLPRIGFDKALVEKVKSLGAEKACATNLGQILPLIDMGFDIIGDYSLNVFNSLFLFQAKELGIREMILSPELMLAQIRDIAKSMPTGVIAYGRLPLMLIENPPKGKKLIDRTGRVLPLVENELLNSYPIYMADKIEDIKNTGVREAKLLFTIESAHEVKEIIYAYKNASESKKEFTRGKFYKGV